MNGLTYIDMRLEDKAQEHVETFATLVLQTGAIEYICNSALLGASNSYVLGVGENKPLDVLRFVVYNDMIPEQLNAAIDLQAFLNIENAVDRVEEAIFETVRMLHDGMNGRIQTELRLAKAQQQPNAIIRNELRRLVDVYGIDAFAKALKQFEREGI